MARSVCEIHKKISNIITVTHEKHKTQHTLSIYKSFYSFLELRERRMRQSLKERERSHSYCSKVEMQSSMAVN